MVFRFAAAVVASVVNCTVFAGRLFGRLWHIGVRDVMAITALIVQPAKSARSFLEPMPQETRISMQALKTAELLRGASFLS